MTSPTGKRNPQKPTTAKDKDAERQRRVEEERTLYDANHAPTEKNARIDGSGARFESDG